MVIEMRPKITAKNEVQRLLNTLPDGCSLDDIQYHLYVIQKVRNGLEIADTQETLSQEEVEHRLVRVTLQ